MEGQQTAMFHRALHWHEAQLDKLQRRMGLRAYHIAWVGFAKGVIIGILLCWLWTG